MSLFSDYTFQIVALSSSLLGVISGVLGCFTVLRKQSLLGDGVSHAALPGVILAFLLIGSKNTEILLIGGVITGLLATYLITLIVKNSRVKFDSALAMVLSVFFGFAMILLTITQRIPNANQAGLDRFIYGQAASLLRRDLIVISVCGFVLLTLVALFWKEFKLLSFDAEFAQTLGFNTNRLSLFLTTLIVIAIIIGLQAVGVILMSCMLIAPAVAARQWVDRLSTMVILSAIFGALSGFVGTTISSLTTNMPTGPVIIICASSIAIFSILFAPKNGVIPKMYKIKHTTIERG